MAALAATSASDFIAATFAASLGNAGVQKGPLFGVANIWHCVNRGQVAPAGSGKCCRSWLGFSQRGVCETGRQGRGLDFCRRRQWRVLRASENTDYKEAVEKPADDVNSRFRQAAKSGDMQLCKELLAAGEVNVNLQSADKGGWTALQLSVFYQHPEVAEFLLDSGADVNGRNASGNTALQFACIKGDVRLASLLIDRGADLFAESNDKGSVIDYAEEWGGEEIVNFIHLKATQVSQMGAR